MTSLKKKAFTEMTLFSYLIRRKARKKRMIESIDKSLFFLLLVSHVIGGFDS